MQRHSSRHMYPSRSNSARACRRHHATTNQTEHRSFPLSLSRRVSLFITATNQNGRALELVDRGYLLTRYRAQPRPHGSASSLPCGGPSGLIFRTLRPSPWTVRQGASGAFASRGTGRGTESSAQLPGPSLSTPPRTPRPTRACRRECRRGCRRAAPTRPALWW